MRKLKQKEKIIKLSKWIYGHSYMLPSGNSKQRRFMKRLANKK